MSKCVSSQHTNIYNTYLLALKKKLNSSSEFKARILIVMRIDTFYD